MADWTRLEGSTTLDGASAAIAADSGLDVVSADHTLAAAADLADIAGGLRAGVEFLADHQDLPLGRNSACLRPVGSLTGHGVQAGSSLMRVRWLPILMWLSGRGEETPEELAAQRRQRRRMRLPTNEMGGVVATDSPVLRSADYAVHLETARMFSTGLQLQFRVVTRKSPEDARGAMSLMGMSRDRDDRLWLGVKLADGRKATTIGGGPPAAGLDAAAFSLARVDGHGSKLSASVSFFLTPLPPPGPVTVVLAWPAFGIAESTVVLTGDAIVAAAERVVILWPEQEEEDGWARRRPPTPPPGGWFEQNPPPSGDPELPYSGL